MNESWHAFSLNPSWADPIKGGISSFCTNQVSDACKKQAPDTWAYAKQKELILPYALTYLNQLGYILLMNDLEEICYKVEQTESTSEDLFVCSALQTKQELGFARYFLVELGSIQQ